MKPLLLILTSAVLIGATPGPAQPPREGQGRDSRPEARRPGPSGDERRPEFRGDRAGPDRPMPGPQGRSSFSPRGQEQMRGPSGRADAFRQEMMHRRMEAMSRMRQQWGQRGPFPGRPGFQGRSFGPGPQGFRPEFRGQGPAQFGPERGREMPRMNPGPDMRSERGRPQAGNERGAQPSPSPRSREQAEAFQDNPDVKKAREGLEKARRSLAEAEKRLDQAVQSARTKSSPEKKPEGEKKDKKRDDKGR
jgi:hypothetical protein